VFGGTPAGLESVHLGLPRHTGASNGPTEAINGVIENNRRIARGFRNFANYRIENLLAEGEHLSYRNKPPNHAYGRRDSLTLVKPFLALGGRQVECTVTGALRWRWRCPSG
jgi:hypothetical protein